MVSLILGGRRMVKSRRPPPFSLPLRPWALRRGGGPPQALPPERTPDARAGTARRSVHETFAPGRSRVRPPIPLRVAGVGARLPLHRRRVHRGDGAGRGLPEVGGGLLPANAAFLHVLA